MSGDDIRETRAREPDPRDAIKCPVVPLGHLKGVYYFLSGAGEIRELKPRDMTALGLLSLFDGDGAWLHEHYAKLDKKDRKTGEIEVTSAAMGMMRRCVDVGLYRPDTPKRSIGVWRDDEFGEIVAHCGDQLVYFDRTASRRMRRRRAAGVHVGHAIYIAAPPIDQPAPAPASRGDAVAMLAAMRDLWRYEAPHLPLMVFGFTALGLLGAAPPWHVHILLIGKRGSGKSTLLKLARCIAGPQGVYWNDPTEAGMRERLSDEARVIFYDEAGDKGGENRSLRVDAIIGLLRRMAEEEGARSLRGSGGAAKEYAMAGSVALAAANAPILDAQDRSRILEIDMLAANPDNLSKVEQAIAEAEKLSPALRARALLGWPRFLANLQVFRQALVDAKCDARQAMQLGTLFAAAEMMTSDAPIDSDSAATQIADLAAVIQEYREIDEELSNARRCWHQLLSYQVDHWKSGAKSSISRIIGLARDPEDGKAARDALPVYGLRLETLSDGTTQELWVANVHPGGLGKIFAGTDWANGGWGRALKDLPGAEVGEKAGNFLGVKSRFTVIPAKLLPDKPPRAPPVGAL